MRFEDPIFFLFLIPIAFVYWWRHRRTVRTTIKFPAIDQLRNLEDRKTRFLSYFLVFLRYVALILLVVTLARPQAVNVEKEITTEGVDILLVMDVSGSMAAEDLKPDNRLAVAKKTVETFVNGRKADRIGLVVFGRDAFTQCPLTLDYGVLTGFLDQVKINMAGDGTAIGLAVATAVNRLKKSDAKSKLVILLTDGENNAGEIDPVSASKLAAEAGIKIYTVGIGKPEGVVVRVDPRFGRRTVRYVLDEETLIEVAKLTKGQYFRAEDSASLAEVYARIDALEKTKISSKQFLDYKDLFHYFVFGIFALILLEILLAQFVVVALP